MTKNKNAPRLSNFCCLTACCALFCCATLQAQNLNPKTAADAFTNAEFSLNLRQNANSGALAISEDAPKVQASGGSKSAFFKSLLLPGWGQHSLGAKKSARTFILSEIAFLGGAVAFHRYSNWLEDDFSALAMQHAGVTNTQAKTAQYWVDVGNFDSIRDFNDEKLRQRNTFDLRDPAGDEFWTWNDRENRREFENLRIRRDRASERSSFAVIGVITNHLTSAIHAMWKARKSENNAKSTSKELKYKFGWQKVERARGWGLQMKLKF